MAEAKKARAAAVTVPRAIPRPVVPAPLTTLSPAVSELSADFVVFTTLGAPEYTPRQFHEKPVKVP